MIPFYGADDPQMFAIERAAMDRDGKVIAELDDRLPTTGRILDVGAGNGFTAQRLATKDRSIVALEPATGMIDTDATASWVQGVAQQLPFADNTFDGVYSSWAYFFPGYHDVTPGVLELRRVTKPGGGIVIIDNAGNDEFAAMAPHDIATDLSFWEQNGFDIDIVESAFVFETEADAATLLRFYFGEDVTPGTRVTFNIAVISTTA
ncbi:MAG: class I SAM-dependent methyltransferase [Acidimicrobiia bacterium]